MSFYSFLDFLSVYCTLMIRNSNAIDIFGDKMLRSWQKLKDSQETKFLFADKATFMPLEACQPSRESENIKKMFCKLIVFVIILTGR